LVLVASGTITALLGEWVDASVIFGVVAVNALVGMLQEGKAEAALAALARAVAAETTVLRGGERRRLDAAQLVPGDVVLLAAGDRVPADLRLLHCRRLRTQESALTGESVPVDKQAESLAEDAALADRHNMAYAGTVVVAGQGLGVVVATAAATETGRISRLMAETPEIATPLTRKMEVFARWLLWAILAMAALSFAVGMARGGTAVEMFMAAVALAVGAIPEGLPAAMTITLAIGVGRMARRRAIVRQLPAVETLGSTTVICSDKTGTLTENAMTVREIRAGNADYQVTGDAYGPEGTILFGGQPAPQARALREVLVAGALCNDAGLHRDGRHWSITGDPTEAALLTAARKGGMDEGTLRGLFPRLDEIPFDAVRQTMTTLHETESGPVAYVKGAVERVLPDCAHMLDTQGREAPLDHRDREGVEDTARAMAGRGLRVLALARSAPGQSRKLGEGDRQDALVLLGLVGMIDPPRAKAVAAVRACHAAGIRVKMITGDHPETARAIARQLGISGAGAAARTGRELAALDEAGMRATAAAVDVFARVEPEQKLRLVRALQANGEVVAMTGDGVNDAPALKQADIGIAMGQGGTEVAKEAANLVLTDDNFATIEAAVEEGRGIYDNLVKFITWTLPTNFGEGLVILAAILAGVTLPITPLQVLWINMTTAVLLGLALAFEPAEPGIMRRPPRPPERPVLDAGLVWRIVLVGVLLLAGSFGFFLLEIQRGSPLPEARTVAVNVFVLVETAYLFNCRSLVRPVLRLPAFSNPWVWAGAASMLLLQLLLTYVPAMNRLFATAPIRPAAWLEIAAFALGCLVIVDLEKAWRSRRR
ncbi:MAG: HAD-IC family P-type ATPase, partial [Rhodocyclaceae bacterium]|nr:HAD-IC family P-type ATPase [Rhodocyclaceae bacterium]